MKYKKILYNQLKNNIEPDCEDFYLCEIEEKAKKYDELIDYLKEKENELQKKVVYYEKQLKGTERSSFYYSSYLKNVHKLNAQRELIKEILSKIEKE